VLCGLQIYQNKYPSQKFFPKLHAHTCTNTNTSCLEFLRWLPGNKCTVTREGTRVNNLQGAHAVQIRLSLISCCRQQARTTQESMSMGSLIP